MFGEVEYSGHDLAIWKLVLMDISLGVIGLASCFNGVIACSLIITFVAAIIKVYKLDPEPFFLLSLHTMVTCLMLHDAVSTTAAIIALSVTCTTTGSLEISSERIAVFLTSLAITSLLGKVAASVMAIALVAVIIAIKLRPLRPAAIAVLDLLVLAVSVPMNGHVTLFLSAISMVVLSIWYILKRFHAKTELLYLDNPSDNHNNNNNNITNNINNNISNNSRLNLMNGGHLKLCNTTDSLDLHGHTVTSALKTLHQFLKEHEDSFRRNRTGQTRYLRVITGEDGKNHSEDNMNLIKPTVANFLKINKYRYQVHPDRPGILKIDLESHVR